MKLSGRTVVVTGGASGIGLAIVQRAKAEGAEVVSIDLAESAHADLSLIGNVSSEESVARAFDAVINRYGQIDGVVANAGIALEVPLTETTFDQWNRVIAVNLGGAFLTGKHAVLRMPTQGSIVFIASMSGLVATASEPAYCASKAGVIGLSRSIAVDYASQGIRANAICPGVVDTDMTRQQFAPNPEFRTMVESLHPMGRFARPEEIAAAATFLLSDDSSFITGSVLTADGGYSAR